MGPLNASLRKPVRQGDLDGLCGLYALLNALDLLAAKPPRPALQKALFQELIRALPAPKLREAMSAGLEGKDLIKAARIAFPPHKRALGGRIEVSRPFRRQAFETSEELAANWGKRIYTGDTALLINFATPTYAHWSVVLAIEPTAIALRDSSSTRSLSLDKYAVRRGPYRIRTRETLMLHIHPLKHLKQVQDIH